MLVEVRCLMDILVKEDEDLVAANAAKRLSTLRISKEFIFKCMCMYPMCTHFFLPSFMNVRMYLRYVVNNVLSQNI